MSLISWSTTSLISGVSQQPDTLRFASQAEVQENGFSSIVDGLTKRHPTEHVAEMLDTAALDGKSVSIHTINRDASERYLVLFLGGDAVSGEIKVWDIENSVFRTIENSGGGSPDFSYLNTTDPSKLRAMSVADNTFVVNPTVKVDQDSALLDEMPKEAFIFVRASNYATEYTAEFTLYKPAPGGGTETISVSTDTWDGNTIENVVNKDGLGVTLTGWTSGTLVWNAHFLGSLFSISQTGPTTPTALASAFASLINASNGLKATESFPAPNGYIVVEGLYKGLDIRGSLDSAPTGGAWSIATVQEHTEDQLDSIQTDNIAADLAGKLSAATSNATFSVVGSVIRCVPKYGSDGTTDDPEFKAVQLKDSNANSMMELTHKKVDAVTDLPLTCVDGFKIEVQGNAEAAEDNFYLEFEATDGADVFGAGIWKETALGGEKYRIDKTTMPHRLERLFTDGGDPYFVWDAVTWEDRLVGEVVTTNSFPSFVSTTTSSRYISDVFFFRNRMGFLSRDNVILSEVGTFENFFRTATTAVLDGDPIDVGVGHSSVAILHSAVSWNEKLVLFSDQTQFVLAGEPYLTPQTVQVSAVTDFENYTDVRPLTSGQGVAFGYSHGNFSGVRELNQVNENVYSADDLTQAIPKYVEGTITTFAPTTLENMLVVLSDGDTSSLYIYKYYFGEGQRLQAAWSKYTFGSGSDIRHVAFIDNTLYMVVIRAEGVFIEKMLISDGQADSDSTYVTTLDRRVDESDCSEVYSAALDTTTITLPYNLESSATYQVVSRATATTEAGHIYTIAATATNTITVEGDLSSAPFWIGEQYNLLYQFSAPRLREATATRGGRGIVATGRQQIKYGTLVYDESGYFKITVTPEGRSGQVSEFSTTVLSSASSLIGELDLDSGGFRFPIHSKNDQVIITLENDSPLPSNFISIEWEADFTSQSKRYRG